MSLPDVNVAFSDQNLGLSGAPNDNVFLCVGASSKGTVNTLVTITDPNAVIAAVGYGPLAEQVAQILNTTSTVVYACHAAQQAGSAGAVTHTGTGTGVVTLPGAVPLNAYNLKVTIISATIGGGVTTVRFTYSLDGGVTVSGAINLALPGSAIGSVAASGTTSPTVTASGSPTEPHTASMVCTRSGVAGPTDGSDVASQAGLRAGFLFNSVAPTAAHATAKITTPASGLTYAVTVAITGTGTAVGASNTSLPAAGTGTAAGSVTINGVVTTFAANHFPAVFTDLLTGVVVTFDSSSHNLTSGDAYSNAGLLVNNNASTGNSLAVVAITTATTGAVIVPVSLLLTASGTAATASGSGGPTTGTGTATGTLHIGANSWIFDTPGGGSGTGGMPSIFTDVTTGVVVKISTGAGNLLNLDAYGDGAGGTLNVQPVAQFTETVDGTPTTLQVIPSNGAFSVTLTGGNITLQFAHTYSDVYTAGGTPSTYVVSTYIPATYTILETDGATSSGLTLSFGFGTYVASDTFTSQCVAPSVLPADVVTALNAGIATNGASFSMVHVAATPPDFATAATIASDVQTILNSLALSPTWRFVSALVYGPNGTSVTSGATPAAFIAATGALALDRVNMSCGADYITSALTFRRDLQNCGFVVTARLALNAVSQDVGAFADGALNNDVSTTTSLADATSFNDNRGITTRVFDGYQGVYCSQGLSLAAVNSDYKYVVNRRVVDKGATIARAALLNYLIAKLRTVKGPGSAPATGTIDPRDAARINTDVAGKIINGLVTPGNAQDARCAVDQTTKILQTQTLNATIGILPYAYARMIFMTIGLTAG